MADEIDRGQASGGFVNFGTNNVMPASQVIARGWTSPNTQDSCATGTAVAPNQICSLYASGTNIDNASLSCQVTFSGSAANVRGPMQLYNDDNNVSSTAHLR